MGMDNSVGIDCGNGVWDGWRRARGKYWDNTNRITGKNFKKIVSIYLNDHTLIVNFVATDYFHLSQFF